MKKKPKPKVPKRPFVTHGGVQVNLPLLSGPVGRVAANASGKYAVFNARADVDIVEYYLSQLAKIKFLSVSCTALNMPGPAVVNASDAVQCWDTNRDDAIKAFQSAMPVPLARMTVKERANYDQEKNDGIILPDGPTLMALVDFGDVAEKLEALKNSPKSPADYMYGGSFSITQFMTAFDAEFGSDYRFDLTPPSAGGANVVAVKLAHANANRQNLTTVVQKMSADSRLLDIRWMAYILATVLHETSLSKKTTVPVLDPKGNPVLKKKKPVSTTFNATSTLGPVEEGGHGAGRNYYLAVKVSRNADGTASVVEPDGNTFVVDATGKTTDPKNVGALPTFAGKAAAANYQSDTGIEHAYFGRGYVQLTWWNNYASAGASVGRGLDLLFNPDLALDPTIAYEVMVHGMLTGDGFANGRRISKYIFGMTKNYVGARAMVNGSDRAADIAAYAERFEKVLMQAKVSP